MESKRVAVTLVNGRSHLVDVPETVASEDAAAVIRGERAGAEVGWTDGDRPWLSFGDGQGWVHRTSIAEIMLVEYLPEELPYGHQIYD